MVNDDGLLRVEERIALQQLAQQPDIEGQRAAALLALDEGNTQAAAAEESGLTVNQVRYIVKKFRSDRLLAFPDAIGLLPAEEVAQEESTQSTPTSEEKTSRLNRLLADVDDLVNELRATLPDSGQYPYSPLKMLTLVRDTADRYTPEIQMSLLEPFEDMTRDDLVDPETWKGLAYMIAYSAQFQAGRTKDVLNEQMPDPLKPDTLWAMLMGGIERITPETAKEILASFEGATREDLLDLDTWKGVWYMLNYSLQFQAEQIKLRLMGGEEEE